MKYQVNIFKLDLENINSLINLHFLNLLIKLSD